MPISDDDLRDLVRESVTRHLRIGTPYKTNMPGSNATLSTAGDTSSRHASQLLLPVASGGSEGDGLCVIEPAVRCNHCGYCQSYGH